MFRRMSFAALGLSLVCSACVQAEEQPDFNTYPGQAVPSPTGGDSDAGDPPGGTTGSGSNGGSSGGTVNGATTGAVSGGVATGGASTGSVTGGATSGTGTTGASGTTGGGATTSGGSNGGTASGGTTTGGASTGGASTGGASTGGGTAGVSSLTFSVLTKAIGGEYAPKNVGAIWITNSSGTFVKTLELWARTRLKYLTLFQQQTNRNSVDAVTSATLTAHRVHNVTWNLKDVNGALVPDGMYNIVIETSDHDTVSHTIPFMKGNAAATITPPDAQHYTQMSIKLQ